MTDDTARPDAAALARRLNFSIVLPGRLAGLGWPFRREAGPEAVAALLREAGVAALVNLTGEAYPAAARATLDGLHLIDLPVDDYTAPSLEQADELGRLFSTLPPGLVLALHCAAGVGRTGTLLACLLGRELGLDGAAALARIRRLRPGSVETAEQEDLVESWLGANRRRG
jgi:atypical dual specificity phosphatase